MSLAVISDAEDDGGENSKFKSFWTTLCGSILKQKTRGDWDVKSVIE